MSRVSVVLWDVEGTLVTLSTSMEDVVRRALQGAGVPYEAVPAENVSAADELRLALEVTWRTLEDEREGFRWVAQALLDGVEVTQEQVKRVWGSICNYYDIFVPVAGVKELLADLSSAGVRQGIISNWPPSLRAFLDHHGFDEYFEFDAILGSGEEGIAKPDPAIFERALARLDADPGRCVYIGNNPEHDIVPARALGMHAIHFDPQNEHPAADARDVASLREILLPLVGVASDPAG